MHYHVLGLNESSKEDDCKKAYRKLALQYLPDINNHPQASAVLHMINEAKEGLKYLLRYNNAMRGHKEDLQHQVEAWR